MDLQAAAMITGESAKQAMLLPGGAHAAAGRSEVFAALFQREMSLDGKPADMAKNSSGLAPEAAGETTGTVDRTQENVPGRTANGGLPLRGEDEAEALGPSLGGDVSRGVLEETASGLHGVSTVLLGAAQQNRALPGLKVGDRRTSPTEITDAAQGTGTSVEPTPPVPAKPHGTIHGTIMAKTGGGEPANQTQATTEPPANGVVRPAVRIAANAAASLKEQPGIAMPRERGVAAPMGPEACTPLLSAAADQPCGAPAAGPAVNAAAGKGIGAAAQKDDPGTPVSGGSQLSSNHSPSPAPQKVSGRNVAPSRKEKAVAAMHSFGMAQHPIQENTGGGVAGSIATVASGAEGSHPGKSASGPAKAATPGFGIDPANGRAAATGNGAPTTDAHRGEHETGGRTRAEASEGGQNKAAARAAAPPLRSAIEGLQDTAQPGAGRLTGGSLISRKADGPAMRPATAVGAVAVNSTSSSNAAAGALTAIAAPHAPSAAAQGSAEHPGQGRTALAFERMDGAPPPQLVESGPQRLAVGVRDGELGWVEIRTHALAGQVVATLVTGSAESHQAITAALPAVRESLMAAQVRVNHVGAETFAASSDQRGNRQPGNGEEYQKGSAGLGMLTPRRETEEEETLSYISVRV